MQSALETPATAGRPDARSFLATAGQFARRPEAGSVLGLVAVLVFFGIFGGATFLGSAGLSSWLNVAAETGIVALPVGLLMIAGELDVSVGAVIPAASVTMAVVSGYYGLPDVVGIVAALLVGLLVGYVNGLLVVRTGIPSLIVTIGTMFGVMGLTLGFGVLLTGNTSTAIIPGAVTQLLLGQFLGGMFAVTIVWWALFIAAFYYLLHVSPVGNWIFALGGDKVSARNAGIPTERLTIALFMLSSFCAAFVGMSQSIVNTSAQVASGQSFIFNSIMCVVIGGVLLTGGSGSIIGIVLGTATFSIVNQGVFFTRFDPNLGSIIIGILLLLAVMTNDTFRQMSLSYSKKK